MKNRSHLKNLDDVKMVITTIAVTLTLGFWSFFSKPVSQAATAQAVQLESPPPVIPTQTMQAVTPVITLNNLLPTPTAIPQQIIINTQAKENAAPKTKASEPKAAGKTGSSK